MAPRLDGHRPRPDRCGAVLLHRIPLAALLAVALAAACARSEREPPAPTPVAGTPTVAATAPAGTPEASPAEVRVAYLNLMSPIVVDVTDPVASETFAERLGMVIDAARVVTPDIFAVSEATWTKQHGSAWAKLAAGLAMEGSSFARATPWFPGQSEEESDALRDLVGFEEGEYLLVRSPYAILRSERKTLNPRVSEAEARAAIHVVVRGPGSLGEFDVYVARLAGNEETRLAQARDLLVWVELTRGRGLVLLFLGLESPPDSPVARLFTERGYLDVAAPFGALPTCCRPTVLSETPQPPLSVRTDYIFTNGWPASAVVTFAEEPRVLEGGKLLYASDHAGLAAAIPVPESVRQEGAPDATSAPGP